VSNNISLRVGLDSSSKVSNLLTKLIRADEYLFLAEANKSIIDLK